MITYTDLVGWTAGRSFSSISVDEGKVVALDGPELGTVIRLEGKLVTPGLVDCHTHLVFAGNRADEFAARAAGATYQEIAANGGGIQRTVRDTRAATEEGLFASALQRLTFAQQLGTTTLEIKSGYGLDYETERKMLRVARRLGAETGTTIKTTFLGLHACPKDRDRDAYVHEVTEEWLPRLHEEGLVDAVDIFCETGYFTHDCARKLAQEAKKLGLPIKLHVDQFGDSGGAALARDLDAISADHLEYACPTAVAQLGKTMPVYLPASVMGLAKKEYPQVRQGPFALASDFNPGSSPCFSLPLVATLAVLYMGATPTQAMEGITIHAATALGLPNKGHLKPGADAEMLIWNASSIDEIPYWMGSSLVERVILARSHRAD